jgi:hypothetical protein
MKVRFKISQHVRCSGADGSGAGHGRKVPGTRRPVIAGSVEMQFDVQRSEHIGVLVANCGGFLR